MQRTTGKAAGLPPPRWLNHNKRLACQMHDTDQLIEICCKEQTQNKREIVVSLRRGRCVRPFPADGMPPHTSLPCVWCSKDLNAFCHRDCPRGKKSNCRKCLVFLPLLRGRKNASKKVNSCKVPRKAVKGPLGLTEEEKAQLWPSRP